MKQRITVAAMMMLLGAGLLAAQSAEVISVSGQVQVNSGAGWVVAGVGDVVDRNTRISTGFGATAEIAILVGGQRQSVLSVGQLTRLTIAELAEREGGSVQTGLNLRVGRVGANVESSDGRPQQFEIRTARSTAAARGTVFTVTPVSVQVNEGSVTFIDASGLSVTVPTGQLSKLTDDGNATDPEEELAAEFGGDEAGDVEGGEAVQTGSLRVIWRD